jgi:succinylglutamate desuccinylase
VKGAAANERQRSGGPTERGYKRRLGDYSCGVPGPLFLITGGIHGNERSGVLAAESVLKHIKRTKPPVRGRVLALAGNLAALALGQRFLEVDLNRIWTPADLRAMRATEPSEDGIEEAERRALLRELERAIAERSGPVVLLDLHSSSAPGEPFVCMGDTLQNRQIAAALPAPVILGLEENIDGALLEYFSERGHAGIAVEGGQHEDPATVENHIAATWLSMEAAGVIEAEDVPDLDGHRRRLARASRGLPRVVEVRHRQAMNFQRVRAREVLATDETGELEATEEGRILLPRYQGLGNDGYFLVRRVAPFWMRLSFLLRKLRLGPVLRLMPGVSAHPERPESLLVDSRVARWRVVEVFHLFGYRRRRADGDRLVFSRRAQRPPGPGPSR